MARCKEEDAIALPAFIEIEATSAFEGKAREAIGIPRAEVHGPHTRQLLGEGKGT